MKDLILIIGMFAAGILALLLGIQGVLFFFDAEMLPAISCAMGCALAVSQVIVLEFVAKRIHEPPTRDDSPLGSDTKGTPWEQDPGHSKN